MEPFSALATLGGGFLSGFMRGGGMGGGGGPNVSSATALGGTVGGPFNVGGGLGGAGQLGALTTGIGAMVPWIVLGVLAWAILKK